MYPILSEALPGEGPVEVAKPDGGLGIPTRSLGESLPAIEADVGLHSGVVRCPKQAFDRLI